MRKFNFQRFFFFIGLIAIWVVSAFFVSSIGGFGSLGGLKGYYSNKDLTPGMTLDVSADEVCVPGYAKSVRNVTETKKKRVYAAYKIEYPQPTGSIETDHWIPLSLGGNNEIENLWPMRAPQFREKDLVEFYLWRQVCKGAMSLSEAQKAIYKWDRVYKDLKNNLGADLSGFTQEEEGNP